MLRATKWQSPFNFYFGGQTKKSLTLARIHSRCFWSRKVQPPIAKAIPTIKKVKLVDKSIRELQDDFSYLQYPSNPLTKSYIDKENLYFQSYFKGTNAKSLYEV